MRNLFGICCLVLALSFAGSSLGQEPPHPEYLHGMVVAAQRVYEEGERLHAAGKKELSDAFFRQSLDIMMEADEASQGSYRARFDRIYAKYFAQRAKFDPVVAEQQVQLQTQIETTYESAPVQPGQVDYMVGYMAKHKRAFLENSFRRSLRYIPMIQEEFQRQGIPPDLAYMALVESGFRTDPTSHAGAQGMWQFMPATARQYGLRVEGSVDERNDPVKSTHAAGRYLQYLHRKFDNWPLAVAAYNCGEGRVERSLRKHNVKTFWDLVEAGGLPRETARYVPSIVAATIISRDPRKYGIDYP
jgi:soluble lytic murein transglycosylase-like protein